MEGYARHVLVCTGGFCSPDHRGREPYALLARLLQREGLLFGRTRVKRGETPCLGVCTGGPIVVVYPDGVWYWSVTPACSSASSSSTSRAAGWSRRPCSTDCPRPVGRDG